MIIGYHSVLPTSVTPITCCSAFPKMPGGHVKAKHPYIPFFVSLTANIYLCLLFKTTRVPHGTLCFLCSHYSLFEPMFVHLSSQQPSLFFKPSYHNHITTKTHPFGVSFATPYFYDPYHPLQLLPQNAMGHGKSKHLYIPFFVHLTANMYVCCLFQGGTRYTLLSLFTSRFL